MKNTVSLIVFLAICFGAALIGAQFQPGLWYETLLKPSFTPSDWVFAPVWAMLYVMMATSGWLAWGAAEREQVRLAFAAYALQLGLNAAWTWIFFGLHRPDLAFAEISLLWISILATVALFWKISPKAALLLLPYLCWTTFAAVLNWKFWQLNS